MQPNDFFYWQRDKQFFEIELAEALRKAPLNDVEDLDAAYALARLGINELRAHLQGRDWRMGDDEFAVFLRTLRAVLSRLGIVFEPEFRDTRDFRACTKNLHPDSAHSYVNGLFNPVVARLEELEYAPDGAILGVDGELKNIIFASTGNKPRIVLRDAINNKIDIVENEDACLVYDRQLTLSEGLTWGDLIAWWRARGKVPKRVPDADVGRDLYKRLSASLSSPRERLLFHVYCKYFSPTAEGTVFPALIPQVYMHYDPMTRRQRRQAKKGDVLTRERMDFLFLLPNRVRVVLEVDGKQHYADVQEVDGQLRYTNDDKANPGRYADMVAEDRRLRLDGYEVYRFGGHELAGDEGATHMLRSFFAQLFDRHHITAGANTSAV